MLKIQLETNQDIINDRSETDTPKDHFTMADAFFLGTMMGFAYEEGLGEKRKRKIEKEKLRQNDKDKDYL